MAGHPHESSAAHIDKLRESVLERCCQFEPPQSSQDFAPGIESSIVVVLRSQRTQRWQSHSVHNLAFSHHISLVVCGMSDSLSFFVFSQSLGDM